MKIAKGNIPAKADVVVTLHYENGLAFFLPDEHRWVVSYPQQHYERGLHKEEATNNRYKRVIRMFKAARNYLVQNNEIQDDTAPSYFIECLLFNVPNEMFRQRLPQSYSGIVDFLLATNLQQFKC
ncbi:nucleotidyltransferase, partial [Chloroflexota bacterium]